MIGNKKLKQQIASLEEENKALKTIVKYISEDSIYKKELDVMLKEIYDRKRWSSMITQSHLEFLLKDKQIVSIVKNLINKANI